MTEPSNKNAPLDRLVDGELSATERQQLLATLDQQPDGWRRCALAFLESQAWGTEFKHLVAEPATTSSFAISSFASTPTSTSSPQMSPGKTSSRWFAIAAGLLLSFGIGWLANSRPATDNASPTMANVEQFELPLREDDIAPVDSKDAVTLLVRDTSGKDRRVQVPLMEVEAFDKQFGDRFAEALPANLREQMRNRGFDMQRRRRFAPMFFEQDQQLVPMVVPVDDTYLVPVDLPIY